MVLPCDRADEGAARDGDMSPQLLPAIPPLWRESRFPLELASLVRDPIYKGQGVEDAGGQPVLLIPGFLAGDDSLGLMTQWLRRTGHRTKSAGIRSNVDCSSVSVERLAGRPLRLPPTNAPPARAIRPTPGPARPAALSLPPLVAP